MRYGYRLTHPTKFDVNKFSFLGKITSVGGVRSPAPIRVSGSALPLDRTVIVGLPPICVVVRLLTSPPGQNSETVPLTRMESPTRTVGLELVKTKIPSDVAALLSGFGS